MLAGEWGMVNYLFRLQQFLEKGSDKTAPWYAAFCRNIPCGNTNCVFV